MNEQTIIDLTFKAGAKLYSKPPTRQVTGVVMSFESVQTFAKLISELEREACAKVCEGLTGRSYEFDMGRLHSAAAIRARGEK